MSEQPMHEELEQMAEALAQQVRERATEQTIDAAERLCALAGEDFRSLHRPGPWRRRSKIIRIYRITLEALFRRRAELTLRPKRSVSEVYRRTGPPGDPTPVAADGQSGGRRRWMMMRLPG